VRWWGRGGGTVLQNTDLLDGVQEVQGQGAGATAQLEYLEGLPASPRLIFLHHMTCQRLAVVGREYLRWRQPSYLAKNLNLFARLWGL